NRSERSASTEPTCVVRAACRDDIGGAEVSLCADELRDPVEVHGGAHVFGDQGDEISEPQVRVGGAARAMLLARGLCDELGMADGGAARRWAIGVEGLAARVERDASGSRGGDDPAEYERRLL